MTRAYGKNYLDDAMRNLGEALDYAVNGCGIDADAFMDMFITGGQAEQFESGVPKYVAGMSGTELAWDVVSRAGQGVTLPDVRIEYDCSPEYWGGWILAYYQWYTGRSFKNIRQHLSMRDILKLYPTLHEASEEKFVDTVNAIMEKADIPTQLQKVRKAVGYSQRTLAEKSGVTLRMIQQYEQRAKDINKAIGTNLLALSKALGCRVEDLIEHNPE